MKHGLQFIYVQSIIQLNQCVLRFDQVIKIVNVGRVKQDYSASICTELLSFTQLWLNDFGCLISNFSSEYLQSRDFNSSSLSLS